MLEKIDNYFAVSAWIHEHDDKDYLSESDRRTIRVLGWIALGLGAVLLITLALLIAVAIG